MKWSKSEKNLIANKNWIICIFVIPGKSLLEVADSIDPGLSKWRGQLLFEQQSAAVVLAQRALRENRMQPYQARVKRNSMQLLIFFSGTMAVFHVNIPCVQATILSNFPFATLSETLQQVVVMPNFFSKWWCGNLTWIRISSKRTPPRSARPSRSFLLSPRGRRSCRGRCRGYRTCWKNSRRRRRNRNSIDMTHSAQIKKEIHWKRFKKYFWGGPCSSISNSSSSSSNNINKQVAGDEKAAAITAAAAAATTTTTTTYGPKKLCSLLLLPNKVMLGPLKA